MGMIEMSEESRRNLEALEKLQGRAPGILRIDRGDCPMHAMHGGACTFCVYGHMTDCHYPQNCEEAECDHWKRAQEEGW